MRKQVLFKVFGILPALALFFSGCPQSTENNDPSAKKGPGFTISGQVYEGHYDEGRYEYLRIGDEEGDMTVVSNTDGGSGIITKGKLNIKIGTPPLSAINSTTNSLADSFSDLGLFAEVVQIPESGVGWTPLILTVSEGKMSGCEITREKTNKTVSQQTTENVMYVYVDNNVTLKFTGKTSPGDPEFTTGDQILKLSKDKWNAIYGKLVIKTSPSTGTLSLEVKDPDNLRWVLEPGD
jgi:hypothetical protein